MLDTLTPYQLNREDSMRVKLNAFNHHPKAWFTSRHARHFMLEVSLEKEKEKTKQKQEENKTKRSLEKKKKSW